MRIALLAGSVLVAIFVILLVVIHLPFARHLVLERSIDFADASGYELEATNLEYNLLTGTASLEGIRVRAHRAEDPTPIFEADLFEVTVGRYDLMRGRLEINGGRLLRPQLSAIFLADGGSNMGTRIDDGDTPDASSGEPLAWNIRQFSIEDGTLRFEDRDLPAAVTLPGWSVQLAGEEGRTQINFAAKQEGSISYKGEEGPIGPMAFEGSLDGSDLDLSDISLDLPAIGARGTGAVSFGGDPAELTVALNLDAETERLITFFQIEQDASGPLLLQLEGGGSIEELSLTVAVQSQNFRYQSLEGIGLEIEAGWTAGADVLDVPSAQIRADFGEIDAQGQIAIDEGGSSEVAAEIRRLQLARLTREFDSPVVVASTAAGSAELSWAGTSPDAALASIVGQASLQLTPTSNARPNTIPVSGRVQLRAETGVKRLNIASLSTMGTEWTGSVTLDSQHRLTGQIVGESESIGESYTAIRTYLGEPIEDAVELDGRLEASVVIAGTLDDVRLRSVLSSRDISAGEVQGAAIVLRADYSDDQVVVENFSFSWAEQGVTLQGRADLSAEQPVVDFDFQADSLDVGAIRSAVGDTTPIDGVFNVQGSVQGPLDSASGELTLSGDALSAYGQRLGSLNAELALADGVVLLNTFELLQPDDLEPQGRITVSGQYQLNDGSYKLSANGTGVKLDGLEMAGQERVAGTLSFDVSGEGTAIDPQLQGNVQLADAAHGFRELGDIRALISAGQNRVDLSVQVPKFNTTFDSNVELAAPYATEVNLSVDGLDLRQIEIEGPQGDPLWGAVTASLAAEGNLEQWRDATATFTLADTSVQTTEDLQLRTEGNVVVRYRNRTIVAEKASFVAGRSTFEVSGSLPLTEPSQTAAMQLQGQFRLDELLPLIPGDSQFLGSGLVDVDVAVRGALTAPEPEGEIRVQNTAIFTEAMVTPVVDVNGTIRFDNQMLSLQGMRGVWSRADLSLDGEIPLALAEIGSAQSAQQPFELTWSLSGFNFDALTNLPRGTSGQMSLNGRVQGTRPEIEALQGEMEITELAFSYEALQLRQAATSRLLLNNGVFTIENFAVQGPRVNASLSGTTVLVPEAQFDLQFVADTDAALLALVQDGATAAGPVRVEVAMTGAASDPAFNGNATWTDGEIASNALGIAAENVNLRIDLEPQVITVQSLTGSLNGGQLNAGGTIEYDGAEIGAVDLSAQAEGVFLEIPEDLRTVSNVNLTVTSDGDNIVFGGQVEVEEGVYRETVAFDTLLVDLLDGAGGTAQFVSEPDPLLARIRFDVAVRSLDPIVIDNNIAQLGAQLDLRLTGSYYQPGLLGRAELEEGGELYISENRYFVDRGIIDFLNENRMQPSLDILARTQVRNYDVELSITGGGPERVETQLTSSSNPELTEPDLISLLLTGRLREDLRGEEVNVAAEQSLSYLTGRIGGRLSRAAEESLGLSEVRIEPNLIAAESDPGARLTVGQNVSTQFSLVYSMNLADSSDQIWTVRYDVTRRFQARAVRQSDNTYRGDFQHDVRFGGGQDSGRPHRRTNARRTVGSVTITGDYPLTEQDIRKRFRVEPGKPYDFFTVNRGSTKVEEKLQELGYLEADVSVNRRTDGSVINLEIEVSAGPQVDIIYEGWSPDGGLRKEVRRQWSDGVFDAQRIDDVRRTLLTELTGRGYLAAEAVIKASTPSDGQKRVLLEIHPNTQYDDIELVFEGVQEFTSKELRKELKDADLLDGLYLESDDALDYIVDLYRAAGYVDVEVEPLRNELNESSRAARMIVPVTEGPRYLVGELAFSGNKAIPEPQLRTAAMLPDDPIYSPELLQGLLLRLQEEYWRAGYQDVELAFRMEKDESASTIRVEAQIEENRQTVIERIEVAGTHATSEKLALSQLGLEPGKPLNFEESGQGRRALYDSGAYSLVDLSYNPLPVAPDAAAGVKPVVANVKLREVRPYQVRYGGFFDTERGPGGILDLRNQNTLGSARTIGARLRVDSEFREGRLFFSQPLLKRFPLSTNFVTYVSRQVRSGEFFDEIDYRRGFSISEEARWNNRYILNFGYRFEKLKSAQDPPDPFFPDPILLDVAPFTVSFTRETRDDILDATRGDFASSSFEWAPTQLGGKSFLHYMRYFGQYFRYFPLSEPSEIPFRKNVRRSRLVFATGARIGLAHGLAGQALPDAEKFFAGGGTTLRGFEEDAVGGIDRTGNAIGGNTIFLLNNELRFPVYGMFGGVVFSDIGNVYPTISDFDIADLRKSAGIGLRLRTPFFLVRIDYGLKLDRRPGESKGQFFFSIGQAF